MLLLSVWTGLVWAGEATSEPEPTAGAALASPVADSGPTGVQTPCEWLLERRASGLAMADLVRLADENDGLFNGKDIRCLKQAKVHSRILEAAEGDLSRDREEAEAEEAARSERAARAAALAAEQKAAEARRAVERAEALENRYDVDIIGIVVGLSKQDGAKWDGYGSIPPEATQGALALMGGASGGTGFEVAALTTYIANLSLSATSAPDPYGYAELVGPHAPQEWANRPLSLLSPTAPATDAFFATFPGSPGFHGFKVTDGDGIRLTFYDDDLTNDDSMGVVELTAADIRKAAEVGGVVGIEVAGRTFNQILALQISVRPAANERPQVRGSTFAR